MRRADITQCSGFWHLLRHYLPGRSICCSTYNGVHCKLLAGHEGAHFNSSAHLYREDPDYPGSCWVCGKEKLRCVMSATFEP